MKNNQQSTIQKNKRTKQKKKRKQTRENKERGKKNHLLEQRETFHERENENTVFSSLQNALFHPLPIDLGSRKNEIFPFLHFLNKNTLFPFFVPLAKPLRDTSPFVHLQNSGVSGTFCFLFCLVLNFCVHFLFFFCFVNSMCEFQGEKNSFWKC